MSIERRPSVPAAHASTTHVSERTGDGVGYTLLVSSAAGASIVPLADGPREVVIGRNDGADIVISDASVSRRHAVLRLGATVTLEDLGTTNGTTVDGRRLEPTERCPVTLGVACQVGSATLVLQRARRPTTAIDSATSLGDEPLVVDPSMHKLYALLDVLAPSPLNVLLLGETGVGKEVFAEAIHRRSGRADRPWLQLNCAALPESIIEGELFGYERGAFTGATGARAGLFESADGGTVFLDEVGELPLATQAKLLRVIESGEVLRLGARASTRVDVRFVAATNRDLRSQITTGRFRSDLFFRLNGMSITIPPLRKRTSEVLPLAKLFASRVAARASRSAPAIDDGAARALEQYAWPGNVRELRNVAERATVIGGAEITRATLELASPEVLAAASSTSGESTNVSATLEIAGIADAPRAIDLRDAVRAAEKERVVEALAKCNGNQARAAEILGVSRRTLINKLDAYGIGRPRKGGS